jgi:uncharacterized membrane protein
LVVALSADENPSPAPPAAADPPAPEPAVPPQQSSAPLPRPRRKRQMSFGEDFRRFFLSGMAALLPTLITLWLLVWAWNFLWESLGQHIIFGIKWMWLSMAESGVVRAEPAGYIGRYWSEDRLHTRVVGVILAVLLVYVIGVFVGNFIGRTFYRLAERAVMRIPLVRAVYPAVKQVTDFVLSKRRDQFATSHVVAVQPHEQGIWSIGLITGAGLKPLNAVVGEDLVTVFVPSTPTAFSGYVLVVPRRNVVELPMTVEEAMRLLVSGGVIVPGAEPPPPPPPPQRAQPKQLEQQQQSPPIEGLELPPARPLAVSGTEGSPAPE